MSSRVLNLREDLSKMFRYKKLSDKDKRRLENDEDKLLVTVLYNMSAFMIMMDVNPQIMRRKVRRMLGKSHIGLQQDKEIQKLLGLVRNWYKGVIFQCFIQ